MKYILLLFISLNANAGLMIHWHPDDRIYIRQDENIIFEGTLEETAIVLGEVLEPLPSGVKERQLFVGSHCADFTKSGQIDCKGWNQSQKIINKLSSLMIAESARRQKLKDDADPLKLDEKIKKEREGKQ
jgi:hypothetical protein